MSGRFDKDRVNMEVINRTLRCPEPRKVNQCNNRVGFDVVLELEIPILTNTKTLQKGDVLMLDMDGVDTGIIGKENGATHTDKWRPRSELQGGGF